VGGPGCPSLARLQGCLAYQQTLRADARRVRLPRVFDVVVSEMVGNEAFEEGLVPILQRARTRFLRPGGALVPEWVALAAAPVAPPFALGLAPPLLPAASVASLTAHVPRNLHPADLVPLARGRELLRLDLREARGGEPLPVARARFRVADGRSVGGIAVWVVMGLAPGVRLSTRGGHALAAHVPPRRAPPRGAGTTRRRDRREPGPASLVLPLRRRPRRPRRSDALAALRLGRRAPCDPAASLTALRAGD